MLIVVKQRNNTILNMKNMVHLYSFQTRNHRGLIQWVNSILFFTDQSHPLFDFVLPCTCIMYLYIN